MIVDKSVLVRGFRFKRNDSLEEFDGFRSDDSYFSAALNSEGKRMYALAIQSCKINGEKVDLGGNTTSA
ncbi:MAG: hypothetical protein NTV48_00050 [Candidatus Vogelbacteria bacterium]|nr:hypothetical protein [Candidatus Vogelbacteria bacterium]